jgi:putative endonuclease
MYYVYLLKSLKNGNTYIGYSSDLKKRFREHNTGMNISTKYSTPWEIIYYEAYKEEKFARERERQLKRFAKSYSMLKRRIGL